jgi:hypothetical protein
MRNRFQMVGYNRTVRLAWLEHTAQLMAMGRSEKQILEALREMLKDQLSVGGEPERGSREKTITLLVKTWVRVPRGLEGFRDDGTRLLQETPTEQHLALHWGMTMAVYPFWRVVAETAGRLLALQGTTATASIQRRVLEQFGQRETVARSARYVLRAFVEWGAVDETEMQGVYRAAVRHRITTRGASLWLVEAMLHSTKDGASDLKSLLESPALFPFERVAFNERTLPARGRLDVVHQDLDRAVVMLRKSVESR